MKLISSSFYVIVVTMCSLTAIAGSPQKGEIVFKTGFESKEERDVWPLQAWSEWSTGLESDYSLRITVPEKDRAGTHMISMPVDITRYRGCTLWFRCREKAEAVTKPPVSYNGTKFMFHYKSDSMGPGWINEGNVYGTFDWKELEFSVSIPNDAHGARISLGLQESSGSAWFDNLIVTVMEPAPMPRPPPMKNPPPVFKGHNEKRLRGVMSPPRFNEEDIRFLGEEWKANVIRWQLGRNWGVPGTDRDLAEYDNWLTDKCEELDKVLESCQRHGLKVVIDLHSPPGGRYKNNDMAMFYEKEFQDFFIKFWQRMARRYKGHPALWGYDLVNEPTQTKPSPDGVYNWFDTQVQAAKAIREIDPVTPIFITSNKWGSPEGFRNLNPAPASISNVIYQVHFYAPHVYTHQGVNTIWNRVEYPGVILGIEWNKERIRTMLEPVREFQLAYNVHIYVGEFSAVRWAPGAENYLRDCIELFEEYDWDWTYHAFREWTGWSLEHEGTPDSGSLADAPTDRLKVMLDAFSRNGSPLKPTVDAPSIKTTDRKLERSGD